jgi:hypothetical protein
MFPLLAYNLCIQTNATDEYDYSTIAEMAFQAAPSIINAIYDVPEKSHIFL